MTATDWSTAAPGLDPVCVRRARRAAEAARRDAVVITTHRVALDDATRREHGLLHGLDDAGLGALVRHGLADFTGPGLAPAITPAGRAAIGRGRLFSRRELGVWPVPFTFRDVSLVDVTAGRPHPDRVRTYAVVTAAGVDLGEVWREHTRPGRHWRALAHHRYTGLRVLADLPSATECAVSLAHFTHQVDSFADPWVLTDVDRDALI
jgi:hypothetical protein